MIKKKYMKPTMQIVQLKHRCQILVASLRSVRSTGLGNDNFDNDYNGGDQKDAW